MIDRYKSEMQDHLVLDSALFSSKLEVRSEKMLKQTLQKIVKWDMGMLISYSLMLLIAKSLNSETQLVQD